MKAGVIIKKLVKIAVATLSIGVYILHLPVTQQEEKDIVNKEKYGYIESVSRMDNSLLSNINNELSHSSYSAKSSNYNHAFLNSINKDFNEIPTIENNKVILLMKQLEDKADDNSSEDTEIILEEQIETSAEIEEEPIETDEEQIETSAEIEEEPIETDEEQEEIQIEQDVQISEPIEICWVDQSDCLLDIAEPDEYYNGCIVNLTDEDRDILGRLLMGETGGESLEASSLVAQCIRDTMVYKGYNSVEEVRIALKYCGRIDWEPNENALNAINYIFDNGGNAVKHKIFYFYAPDLCVSDWHESQKFIIEFGGHRYFSTWD